MSQLWGQAAESIMRAVKVYVHQRTYKWITQDGRIDFSNGRAGFVGIIGLANGGTGNTTGGPNYTYLQMTDSDGNPMVNSEGSPILVKVPLS